MNIRILAASALALAILVPAANAASENGGGSNRQESARAASSDTNGTCPDGYSNLVTDQCTPYGAKVAHAPAIKHAAKPVAAY